MHFLAERPITAMVTIDVSRFDTYVSGINLFLTNPIFGAGLGAGIRDTGLVIHNLYLWVLGEMGIVGAVLCIPLFTFIMCVSFKKLRKNTTL